MEPAGGTAKRYFTVATAGHVDHGKTSLLKTLTGIDPDRLKEEKQRQMTTDLGFAHLHLDGDLVVGFVDVPGHGKFLKNMLAGVGGIDIALLIVAADEGPMPQTRQHVKILSLLGIRKVLVAITKIDVVDTGRIQEVKGAVWQLLSRFDMEAVGWAWVSSTRVEGFDEFKGTLLRCLKQLPLRNCGGAAFLPVDRVFRKPGFGTVVTGTLVRGALAAGDTVWVQPGASKARVRRLETFGDVLEKAAAGQRLACNLNLKDNVDLARGFIVSTSRFEPAANLVVTIERWKDEMGPGSLERISGQDARLYHGTAEYHGKISWVQPIETVPDKALGQISLTDPAIAAPGERFVLRFSDDTICGGTIAAVNKPRWLTRLKLAQLAECFAAASFEEAVLLYIGSHPQRMATADQLHRILPPESADAALHALVSNGRIVELAGWFLPPDKLLELKEKVLKNLREKTAKAEPSGRQSIALEHLRAVVLPGLDRSVFQALIEQMLAAHQIVRDGDKVVLPGAVPVNEAQVQLAANAMEHLEQTLCVELTELARLLNSSADAVKAAIQTLAAEGKAVIVNYDFAASSSQIRHAHKILSQLWKEKKEISPSEFRERLGTSRKFVMPLLAYFDDRSITRRVGNGRVLLKEPN